MPAEPPQAPANYRVNQNGYNNSTNNNSSNIGNIQNVLAAITQALTQEIDKIHTPKQKSYHTKIYNKSHGHNKPHNHNRQHHSRYQHKHKQQTQIAEVEVCDCEECNHCTDDCTDCDSNPITSNDSPDSETPKN